MVQVHRHEYSLKYDGGKLCVESFFRKRHFVIVAHDLLLLGFFFKRSCVGAYGAATPWYLSCFPSPLNSYIPFAPTVAGVP
jgi:hypothetical protein